MAYVNLYEPFILGVNIKYIVLSILYRHINVPMACKELICVYGYDCLHAKATMDVVSFLPCLIGILFPHVFLIFSYLCDLLQTSYDITRLL